jgi:hypothetical protein
MSRPDEPEDPARASYAAEPGVPPSTAQSWRDSETTLFTGLLAWPDLYQGVISLVGATVSRLRTMEASTSALLDAADTITTVVQQAAEDDGLALGGIDPALVGRAALAVRHREVVVEQAAAVRRDRLEAAAPAARGWVVLEEAGSFGGDPFMPYRRLEAQPATGRGVLVTTTPDDEFRSAWHDVQAVSVDPRTGRIEAPSALPSEPRRFRSSVDREAYVTTLRNAE